MHAFKMSGIRAKKTLNVNTGIVDLADVDGKKMSNLLLQGRDMSQHVAQFLKKHLPRCENSFVVNTITMLGVRQTRWQAAEFTLTEESHGTRLYDAVERGVKHSKWRKYSTCFAELA